MARRRSSRYEWRGAALVVALLASVVCSLASPEAAAARERAGGARFKRPDARTVHAETKDILSHPRFAPRRSPLHAFWQWLREKLSRLRLKLPDLGLGPTASRIVWWIIIIWCVLTLAAIVAHFVWTGAILFRRPGAELKQPRFERLRDRSFKELSAMMRELAAQGEYREAIGVMMVALLRWLDDADIFRFHRSKTNGDYVLEYPKERAGRGEFNRFAVAFDGAVYGGAECDRREYERMNDMFERVMTHAGEKP